MSNYPRFQYSVFLKNARDEQIVIRNDDKEQWLEDKKFVNKILEKVKKKSTQTTIDESKPCKDCGSPTVYKEGTSKAGKPWKAYFCQGEGKHVEWVK